MSHCCLCGLLCSLDCGATGVADSRHESRTDLLRAIDVEDCHRRNQWLAQAHSNKGSATNRTTMAAHGSAESQSAQITAIAALFKPTQRSLIWIDGADVNTTRSAVSLAETICATVHVGQSSGASATHRVLANQGWLGSSLSEVATHADLIVTLGGGLRSEAPLLTQRFLAPALASGRAQWCHVDVHNDDTRVQSSGSSASKVTPSFIAVWPRDKWYESLTHILLALQEASPTSGRQRAQTDDSVDALVSKLRRAKNIVWIWDAEEFRDAIDELCISRLLGISRLLMQSARCSLLCLESQVGRVTAQETLLWLTGCSGTADFDGARWSQPLSLGHIPLEEWQHAFDSILVVRSVPSVYPLPDLDASHFMLTEQSMLPDDVEANKVTRVSTVGIDSGGHLMRGDRATMMYCAASAPAASESEPAPTRLPTAAALLDQVRNQLQSGAAFDAN